MGYLGSVKYKCFVYTVKLASNDICFEPLAAINGQISLLDLAFHVYFAAKLSNVISGHILGNFHSHSYTWWLPYCLPSPWTSTYP